MIYRRLKGKNNLQEKLVGKYYEEIEQQNDIKKSLKGADDGSFEGQKVYDRILDDINRAGGSNRTAGRIYLYAAAVAVFLLSAVAVYHYRDEMAGYLNPVAMLERKAENGRMLALTLADGTRVWLNAGSRLRYPGKFNGGQREVCLTGEAYFEVVHRPDKPFIIHSDKITTTVLGTSFNINAYGNSRNIKVTVLTGKVGVTLTGTQGGGEPVTLYALPDQQIVYTRKTGSFKQLSGVNASDIIDWKTGELSYKSAFISEIVDGIARKYDIKISADDSISNCLVSVDFDNEPLDVVLKILAELVNGKVLSKDGVYRLSGQTCSNNE